MRAPSVSVGEDHDAVLAVAREQGGGQPTSLTDATQLVPAVMRFTIEQAWWSVFDAFYELYVDTCR